MPEIIITEPGGDPESHQFKPQQDKISLGRGSANDIVTRSSRTSGEHCMIERVEGGYIMRDKGSTNGIKLEKTRMEAVDLHHGTVVSIGDVLLEFRLSKEERKKLGKQEFTSGQQKKQPAHKAREQAPDEGGAAESSGGNGADKVSHELSGALLQKLRDIDWSSIWSSMGELVGKLLSNKKEKSQTKQGVSWLLLLAISLIIFYTLYKLTDPPENQTAALPQETGGQTQQVEDETPPPLDPDSIELSEVVWDADENDNMRVMFWMTNNHPHPVSNLPVRFRFYDVLGDELGGAKTVIFPDLVGAGERKKYSDYPLGSCHPDTIKVTAEVIPAAEVETQQEIEAADAVVDQAAAGQNPAEADPADAEEPKEDEAQQGDPFSPRGAGQKSETSPEMTEPENPQ